MSQRASRPDEFKTRGDKVVPLFRPTDTARTDTAVPQNLLDISDPEEFEERLKGMMKEAIYESFLEGHFSNPPLVDDPVDVIHLGEPDPISKDTIAKLKKCARIQDLSNTISFLDDEEA